MKKFSQDGKNYVRAALNGSDGVIKDLENPRMKVFDSVEAFDSVEVNDAIVLIPKKESFNILAFELVWSSQILIYSKSDFATAAKDLKEKIELNFSDKFSSGFKDFLEKVEQEIVVCFEKHFEHYPLRSISFYVGYNNYGTYGNCFGITLNTWGDITDTFYKNLYFEKGLASLVEDFTQIDLFNDRVIHLVARNLNHA